MNWVDKLFGEKKRVFLDYASATPVLPEVKRAMESYESKHFHNPSAIYKEGVEVKRAVENNRARLARVLGVTKDNIIFTSSATEANNLAVLGTFSKSSTTLKRPHVIVSAIEHPALIAAAEEVVRRGGEMSILEVDEDGLVSPESLKKLIKRTTILISVGLANHEIGTVQPLAKIGRIVRKYRKEHNSAYPYLHTDVSAAANHLSVYMESLQADLLTLDGAKVYGPKGIGLLAVRGAAEVFPIIFGGEQEGGRRAGTLNPALISGLTIALEIVEKCREGESVRLEKLRKYFIESVSKTLPQVMINGSSSHHLPNIVSVSVPNVLSEFAVLKLDRVGIMISTGSACSLDGRVGGSPIITALGKKDLAESTLRFSFGRETSINDIKYAIKIFCYTLQSMIK